MFYGNLTGFGGGGPAPFVPNQLAVLFDGTNDSMKYTGTLSGAEDSKTAIWSYWVLPNNDGQDMKILDGSGTDGNLHNRSPVVYIASSTNLATVNTLRVGASTPEVQAQATDITVVNSKGWQHIIFSYDAAGSNQIYINGAEAAGSHTANLNEDMELTSTVAHYVGMAYNSGGKLKGDLAEVYFGHGDGFALDISVAANLQKFRTADGKPADLGTDGTGPGLGQPVCYFSVRPGDSASDFATNRGSAGNFTISGALTLSSSNPSD